MTATPVRDRNAALVARAARVMPGACLGTFQLPQERQIVVAAGRGARLWDVDGNAYIDYVLGSGPLLIGHAHPAVVEAVQQQAAKGSTFYTLTKPTIALAETIVDAVPCAEAIKFVSTGTEATAHALRLARAFTARPHVLKFTGGYHGAHDYAMVGTMAGDEPARMDSAGVPEAVASTVLTAPFNDLETARRMIAAHAKSLAAVIVEPVQRVIPPAPGFLAALREITRAYDVPLIFDEVVTGFRLAYGGAQEYYGVVPDLATYGKAISGGYPLAAICGRADILALTDPRRRGNGDAGVYIGGTLSGNPIAAVAGLATLAELRKPGVYDRLFAVTQHLRDGIEALGRDLSISLHTAGVGPLFQVYFTDRPIRTHADTLAADADMAWRWGMELVARGLFHTPGFKFYVSTAHGDAEIAETLAIFADALQTVRA